MHALQGALDFLCADAAKFLQCRRQFFEWTFEFPKPLLDPCPSVEDLSAFGQRVEDALKALGHGNHLFAS